MSFNPSGGGAGSISGSSDVALNNPANGEVLGYDGTTSKWKNISVAAGDLTSHTSATDPHATSNYAIMADGGRRIFTRSTDPADDPQSGLQDGDIWLAP